MKLSALYIGPTLLAFLQCTKGWGTLGHTTVAYIASDFVHSNTKSFFQALLKNETNSYLANVATWADSYRYTAAGRFSAPFHFIDALDHPPHSCDVQLRDCSEEGCIVTAIQNYTSQLLDPDLAIWSKNMAAKFMIHFLGDIHQPLHAEGLEIGGNRIAVNFGGTTTNLHHVWDSNIPEKLVGGYTLYDILTTSIRSGAYRVDSKKWLNGIDISDPTSTALKWAQETNQLVCTAVLPDGVESLTGKDLSRDYYEETVPIVQLQVAKAGYRLAAWLDLIAQEYRMEL